ncbi:MAG: hypothetical protein ACKO96_33185 [Flammeovirgaceae bacterium]
MHFLIKRPFFPSVGGKLVVIYKSPLGFDKVLQPLSSQLFCIHPPNCLIAILLAKQKQKCYRQLHRDDLLANYLMNLISKIGGH